MPSQAYLDGMQVWIEWNRKTDLAAPLAAVRRTYEETFLRTAPVPQGIEICEVNADGVPAEWVGIAASFDRAILFLHGGGYLVGSKSASRGFTARLSEVSGRKVCAVDYRLSPEHPFPAAENDAVAAYLWLKEQGCRDIAVVGESAGGGLAVALMMRLRELQVVLPSSAILISPWLDLAVEGDSAKPGASHDPLVSIDALRVMAALYVGENVRAPTASPLHGDVSGLPPMLLMAGSIELLRDDAIRFADCAQKAEVPVELFLAEGMAHIWPLIAPDAPEGVEALRRACEFIAEHQSEADGTP